MTNTLNDLNEEVEALLGARAAVLTRMCVAQNQSTRVGMWSASDIARFKFNADRYALRVKEIEGQLIEVLGAELADRVLVLAAEPFRVWRSVDDLLRAARNSV